MEKSSSMPSLTSPTNQGPLTPSSHPGRSPKNQRTAGGLDLGKSAKHIDGLFASGIQVAVWNARDVGAWVELIGLPQYRKMFVSGGVDGSVLLKMNQATLEYVGVRNLGHRDRIMADIGKLKEMTFNVQDDAGESGVERQQVVGLVKQQQSMADQTKAMKELRLELSDLAKRGVFARLQQCIDIIGMEGGKDLVKQAYDSICQIKAKLSDTEEAMLEKKAKLSAESAKAARQLGLRDADMLKSLSSTVTMPSLAPPRTLDKESLENLSKRLHPDPDLIKEQRAKELEVAKEKHKSRRLLNSDELSEQFGRLYPDPMEQRDKWKKREVDQDMEIRRMVARGTYDMEKDERKTLIEGFHERWRADMVRRGLI